MDESLALGVIAEQLGVPVDSLSAETAFADLNADSLELFQIIVALEEKFDIEFDNDRAESIKLVGDVLDYIAELVAASEVFLHHVLVKSCHYHHNKNTA